MEIFFFPILALLILGGIISFILLSKKNKIISTNEYSAFGPIEMQTEYKITTNKNDLKRIYINQRYYEDINVEGALTKNFVDRKTNYDIYIISETESEE